MPPRATTSRLPMAPRTSPIPPRRRSKPRPYAIRRAGATKSPRRKLGRQRAEQPEKAEPPERLRPKPRGHRSQPAQLPVLSNRRGPLRWRRRRMLPERGRTGRLKRRRRRPASLPGNRRAKLQSNQIANLLSNRTLQRSGQMGRLHKYPTSLWTTPPLRPWRLQLLRLLRHSRPVEVRGMGSRSYRRRSFRLLNRLRMPRVRTPCRYPPLRRLAKARGFSAKLRPLSKPSCPAQSWPARKSKSRCTTLRK